MLISTCIIIASGPSLTKADVKLCEDSGLDLIGINNAYQLTDKLSHHYACDLKWWRQHWHNINHKVPKYALRHATCGESPSDEIIMMEQGNRTGLSDRWPIVCYGGNSGYQAINLAYLLGYTTCLLIGYDMGLSGKRTHWHGDHGDGLCNPVDATFIRWIRDFKDLSKEIELTPDFDVINVTRKTNLHCFPEINLEDAINEFSR